MSNNALHLTALGASNALSDSRRLREPDIFADGLKRLSESLKILPYQQRHRKAPKWMGSMIKLEDLASRTT